MAPTTNMFDLTMSSDDEPPTKRARRAKQPTQPSKHIIDLVSDSDEVAKGFPQSSNEVPSMSSTAPIDGELSSTGRNTPRRSIPAIVERTFHGSTFRSSTPRLPMKQSSLSGSVHGSSPKQKPSTFAPHPSSGSTQLKHSVSNLAARVSSGSPQVNYPALNSPARQKPESSQMKHPSVSLAARPSSKSPSTEEASPTVITESIIKPGSQTAKAPTITAGTTAFPASPPSQRKSRRETKMAGPTPHPPPSPLHSVGKFTPSRKGKATPTTKAIRALPIVRQVELRAGKEMPPDSRDGNVQAKLAYERGIVASTPCKKCAGGYGRFQQCIILPGYFSGGCASCRVNDQSPRCELYNSTQERQPPNPTSKRQVPTPLEPSAFAIQNVGEIPHQNHFPNIPGFSKPPTPILQTQAPREGSPLTAQNAAPTSRRFPHPGKPLSEYLPNARRAFEMPPSNQKTQDTPSIIASRPVANINREVRNLLREIELEKARGSVPTSTANSISDASKALYSLINTDSPILPHVRRKRGEQTDMMPSDVARSAFKQNPAHNPMHSVPTTDELKELLGELDQEMRQNHAATVSVLLEKARNRNKEIKTKLDEISPFASLKSVELETRQRPPTGARSIGTDTFIMNGKSTNNNTKFLRQKGKHFSYSFDTEVKRVPRYHALTIVRRNILTADDEKLRFIPYLENDEGHGAPGKRIERDLLSAYKDTTQNEPPVKEEKRRHLCSQIDWWLQNLSIPCTRHNLEQFILAKDNKGKEYQLGLLRSFGDPLKAELKQLASSFSEAFEHTFKIQLRDQQTLKIVTHNIPLRDVILSPARLKELVDLRKTSRKSIESNHEISPIADLETYVTLGCLICSAIDCQTHGEYNSERPNEIEKEEWQSQGEDEIKYLTIPQRLTMQAEQLLRKYDERLSLEDEESNYNDQEPKPCSEDCGYRSRPYTGEELSIQNVNDIRLLMITIRNRQRQSCGISRALELPCWKVFREIGKCEREGGVDLKIKPVVSKAKSKRPDWYDNRKRKLIGDWQNATQCYLPEKMAQTFPCIHAGHCDESCYCVQENILCESFCSCSHDCPRRFTGCGCHAMTGTCCVADTCICIQLNRECGPQCGTCGALERLDPLNKDEDELFETGCQNVCIQRGVSKRLIVGESQLAGFGCYTAEAIKKGDFVSEYKGEVISHGEADRRGIVYDRLLLSFLFDLNSEYAIDAARFGNKTRFINHADCAQNGLNCEARIYLVNGEHRIKFIALRDINVGEELLFNYGKKFAEKHGLDKKLPKVKEGTKKGVVMGSEALDMLDGVDDRKREKRGKMFATRGGRSGRAGKHGQQKARKSAPNLAEREEHGDKEDDDSMPDVAAPEEDDDYDDAEKGQRPIRKRIRPFKYTR